MRHWSRLRLQAGECLQVLFGRKMFLAAANPNTTFCAAKSPQGPFQAESQIQPSGCFLLFCYFIASRSQGENKKICREWFSRKKKIPKEGVKSFFNGVTAATAGTLVPCEPTRLVILLWLCFHPHPQQFTRLWKQINCGRWFLEGPWQNSNFLWFKTQKDTEVLYAQLIQFVRLNSKQEIVRVVLPVLGILCS